MRRATGKVGTAGGADGQSSLISEIAEARNEVGDMSNEVTTPAQAEASTVSSKDAGGVSKLEQEKSTRQELNELHAKVDAMWEKAESSSIGKTAPTAAKIPATQPKPKAKKSEDEDVDLFDSGKEQKSALTEENEKLKREINALKEQMKQIQGPSEAERQRVSNEMQKLEKKAEKNKREEEHLRYLNEALQAGWQSLHEQRKQQQSNPMAVATGTSRSHGLAHASTMASNWNYTGGQQQHRCDFCRRNHPTESCPCQGIKCMNCDKVGHMAYQCPDVLRCRWCRQPGHLAKDCPKRFQ